MNQQHFVALLRVELRRTVPTVARMVLVTVAVLGIFTIAGRGSAENLAAVLAGTTIGYAILAPMSVAREKIDGTLEFLRTLPTSASTITAAKFTGVALVVLPGALQIAIAFIWLARPLLPLPNPAMASIGVFLGSWLTLALAGWALMAAMARYELKTLFGAPLIVAAVLMVAVPVAVERIVPDPMAALQAFAARPAAPAIVTAVFVLLAISASLACYVGARNGIARFRPRPDEIVL